jgi:hypothetical protein
MCPSPWIFMCGLNMTMLNHVVITKCINGGPKIILDAELVTDVKLQFPGLHSYLTWILPIL